MGEKYLTCKYSDGDGPIVACALRCVALTSECEECSDYKPRPSEGEKQEEFHALTAHRYDKRREIR